MCAKKNARPNTHNYDCTQLQPHTTTHKHTNTHKHNKHTKAHLLRRDAVDRVEQPAERQAAAAAAAAASAAAQALAGGARLGERRVDVFEQQQRARRCFVVVCDIRAESNFEAPVDSGTMPGAMSL